MFFQNFGIWQILIILLLVLILFGVGKLPEVGRGLGRAIREFRSNVGGDDRFCHFNFRRQHKEGHGQDLFLGRSF